MSKGKFRDLTGQTFGRLTVIERAGRDDNGRTLWHCKCECGNTKNVAMGNLTSGKTQSCGCLKIEHITRQGKINGEKQTTHKGSGTKIYALYHNMLNRCYKPKNNPAYYYYGAVGITVCDEWRNSFETFRDWALANGYKEGLAMVRKDKEKPYGPDNCIFIPRKEVTRYGKERKTA